MYEVLVPVGDSEDRAAAAADAVADLPLSAGSDGGDRSGGEDEDEDEDEDEVTVSVLHVFVDNPSGAGVGQVAAVRRAEERLTAAGHEPRLIGASGDPAAEIVDTAEARDVDLVVLAGRKRSAAGKLLFGSTTQEVLIDLDRPVLVAATGGVGADDGA